VRKGRGECDPDVLCGEPNFYIFLHLPHPGIDTENPVELSGAIAWSGIGDGEILKFTKNTDV
jgi:hypothetical protein